MSTTKVDYESLLSEKTTLEEKVIQLNLVIKEHESEKENITRENKQLSDDIRAVKNDLSTLQTSLESTAITKSTVEEVSRLFDLFNSLSNNLMHNCFALTIFHSVFRILNISFSNIVKPN